MQIRVNDPDVGDFTHTVSLQVSNEAPVKNSQNQVGINAYAGAGFTTCTFDVDNGSQLSVSYTHLTLPTNREV